jgi:capsular exopolysaccharide synthesis family protein
MLKVHLRRTLIAALIFGLLGFFIAARTPKLYEATVDLKAGSPTITPDATMPLEVRRVLLPGVLNDLDSDTGILKSQRIFRDGLIQAAKTTGRDYIASRETFEELFPLYDVAIPAAMNQYVGDQQRVVTLRVKGRTPEDAAEIANAVAYSFAEYRKQNAKIAIQDALDIVSQASKSAKAKLDAIDKQYKTLKIDAKIADMSGNSEAMTASVESLRQKRAQVEAELEGAIAEVSALQREIAKTPEMIAAGSQSLTDPRIDGLRTLVVGAEQELETIRVSYLDSSVQVKNAQEKLRRAKESLAKAEKNAKSVPSASSKAQNAVYLELNGEISRRRSQIANLRAQLDPINLQILQYEGRIAKIPNLEKDFYELQRNRLVYEEQYQTNQKWVEQLSTATEGRATQIVALADAALITKPVAPEPVKNVILGAVIGFLLGMFYSFARESFQLPVHTSWQLAELTALPVAASVPATSKVLAKRHLSSLPEASFKPIESFRYMAFSMMAKEQRPGVIMFTGVGEEVDSSGVAAEFAVAMAKTGCRTLLVDCDLRVPRLSQIFNTQGRSGVSDILGRTILPGESSDLFVSTEHDNLQILPAGSTNASGMADFVTSHLQALIEELRLKGDLVVINCPPVDVFADSSRLAQYVDEATLVISAKSTSYRAVPIAQEIMTKAGAKSMSIVLTNASPIDEPFGNRSLGRFRTQ